MNNINIVSPDVALEAALLNILSFKADYDSYIYLLDIKRLLPDTKLILQDYKKYYSQFANHEHIDFGLFYTEFSQNWHYKDLSNEELDYYKDYVFPAIKNAAPESRESCLVNFIKQVAIEDLNKNINNLNITELRNILDKFESTTFTLTHNAVDPDAITATTVDLEILDKSKGIPYFLPELQNSLGGLIQGQFVVIAADKNTGKSAFTISQAVHAFKHLSNVKDSGPILYFNSEGTPADIYGRFWSNLYRDVYKEGMEEIVEKRTEIRTKFIEEYDIDKFVVFQLGIQQLDFVEQKIRKYNPSLVIIDMLDSLANEEDAISLKKLYDSVRRISLSSCPIIGTTQSGNTGYFDKETGEEKTKRFLSEQDVLGCKAKVASAETFIGIGREPSNPHLRFISTPKVKRGEPIKFTCQINPKYSSYEALPW